jgi:hypothetical protein
MKKLQIILVVLILLALFSSCEKSYFNPIESYYEINNPSKKWVFSSSSFGLDVRNPYLNIDTFYWIKCEKYKGVDNFDYIYFNNNEYMYTVNKDTLYLKIQVNRIFIPAYTLVYNRSKQNFPGIFQRK